MDPNTPLISVIVPVYNVEMYLADCLDSIINQSYKNLEIIVVNDGSTDSSASICDKYQKLDKRIKVIHQENAGLAGARNSGLDAASGQWIAFVDSDDWIEVHMYENLLKAAVSANVLISACGYKKVGPDNGTQEIFLPNALKSTASELNSLESTASESTSSESDSPKSASLKLISNEDALGYIISGNNFSQSVWNKLFCNSLISNTNTKKIKSTRFDPKILQGEDKPFMAEIISNYGGDIAYIPGCLYNYRLRQGSITQSFSLKRLTDLDAWEKVVLLMTPVSKRLTYMAQAYMVIGATSLVLRALDNDKNDIVPMVLKRVQPYVGSCIRASGVSFRLKLLSISVFLFPKLGYLVWKKWWR